VVVQCVVQKGVEVYINHPAFTNGEQMTCAGVVSMVVFCSAEHLTQASRFVGIVASDQTAHGTMHGHVSVFVRGCVTMACDLTCLDDVRHSMVTLAFTTDRTNPNRFVGTHSGFVPPSVARANPQTEPRVLGTLVEKGRPPSNEIRLILEPQRSYHHTFAAHMLAAAKKDGVNDPLSVCGHFTLNQAHHVLRNEDLSQFGKTEALLVQLREEFVSAVRSLNEADEIAAISLAVQIADGGASS
jgi:hypothetical protein